MKLSNCNSSLLRGSALEDWVRASFAGLPLSTRYYDVNGFTTKNLAAEVDEDAENFYVRLEVPGVKKEAVKLDLNNRLLTVSVEKKEKRGETESSYTLTRSVSVPETVNAEAIGAKLEDGILTVTLPKAEERKPRAITVA